MTGSNDRERVAGDILTIAPAQFSLRGCEAIAPFVYSVELSRHGRRIADNHLDTTVLLPARSGIVGCHRVTLALAHRREPC